LYYDKSIISLCRGAAGFGRCSLDLFDSDGYIVFTVADAESPLLYERLKQSLKAQIAAKTLGPGDRVPSERNLVERYGVSRITVKKAVADLVLEGVLEHLPGRRGSFVRRLSFPGSRPGIIAVAIDDVRNSFGAQMLRGIEDFLWDRRIHTLICNADRDFSKVEEYFLSFPLSGISGVILAPVIDHGYREKNRRLVGVLERQGIPYALIDRYIPGLLANYAVANHEESSRVFTRHLLDRGRRVLLVRGLECTSMDDRVQGYRNAHDELGLDIDERLIVTVNDNLLGSRADPEQLQRIEDGLLQAGSFDCVFALNDGLLKATLAAMPRVGIDPSSILVVTHSGTDQGPTPPLSRETPYFIEPTYEMGWEAARILLEHIQNPDRGIVQMVLKSKFLRGGAP